MNSTIRVNLPQADYDIAIAPGTLNQVGDRMQQLNLGKKVLLVSNSTVFEHYGQTVIDSLQAANFNVTYHLIPDGEQYKNLGFIAQVYDTALASRLERSSTLVALGGGVIGDMTGFSAATWL